MPSPMSPGLRHPENEPADSPAREVKRLLWPGYVRRDRSALVDSRSMAADSTVAGIRPSAAMRPRVSTGW